MGQELTVSVTCAHIHLRMPCYLKLLFMFILKEDHDASFHLFPNPACHQRNPRQKLGYPMQVDHSRRLGPCPGPNQWAYLCSPEAVSRNTDVSEEGTHNHGVLCSIPRTCMKMSGMVKRTCNSNSGEIGTGDPLGSLARHPNRTDALLEK